MGILTDYDFDAGRGLAEVVSVEAVKRCYLGSRKSATTDHSSTDNQRTVPDSVLSTGRSLR